MILIKIIYHHLKKKEKKTNNIDRGELNGILLSEQIDDQNIHLAIDLTKFRVF